MTPTQISEIEACVAAIRDIDERFGPALDAQKAAMDAVDALSQESEAARSAYESLMWQLKDDPDLLNTAQAVPQADDNHTPGDAPGDVVPTPEPEPVVEAPPVEPVVEPAQEPVVEPVVEAAPEPAPVEPAPSEAPVAPVEGADAPVEDTNAPRPRSNR